MPHPPGPPPGSGSAGPEPDRSTGDREAQLAPERDGFRYPLYRRNDRQLAPDYAGPLYVWDIDNTYLQSEYSTLRDLIRIRFEAALDKRPVAGVVELLAALRRGGGAFEVRPPVYFVSASPRTMQRVLERRMLLDGVVHDGISFRDLSRLRFLKDIFGYKLAALLLLRLESPPGAREVLFGDDREHDPLAYMLYARVCAGALRGRALREHLLGHGVRADAARYVASLASELPERDPVAWIIIRRLGRGGPEREEAARAGDERLVFVDDYGQAAVLLRALELIGDQDLERTLRAVWSEGSCELPLGAAEAVAPRLPPIGLASAREVVQRLVGGRAAGRTSAGGIVLPSEAPRDAGAVEEGDEPSPEPA